MTEKTKLIIGEDGLLRDANGKYAATFVNSFLTAELPFAEVSVICLRLYESTEHPHGRKSAGSADVEAENAHQFRMSTKRARVLAERLLYLADQIEGRGAELH